jgi:ABC-type lipoprotein export system ATPase subunit
MSDEWNWPGSKWWRVDLHTHSPASYDFEPKEDRDKQDWQAWIVAQKRAGLDAVALTDHHTPTGIDPVLEAASKVGGLVVFPGVEVPVGAVHLLFIFDLKATRDEVVALLGALGIGSESFGRKDALARESIVKATEIGVARGALVIAPHINAAKGILCLAGQERQQVLEKSPGLSAIEVCLRNEGAEWKDPSSEEFARLLGNSNRTRIWCSDSHRFSEMGRHFSWIKMTRPDLEGLRLALLDGKSSVLPGAQGGTADPNRHASLVIESLLVTKAKYIGRSKPLEVRLNPWLNAIIGGRGSGKSTLVDLLRQVFRRDDELGSGGEKLKEAFAKRMRVPEKRDDLGLLRSDTSVQVVIRKDGERFCLVWDLDGRDPAISRIVDGKRVTEEGEIRERFPIRIYSQRQLFETAQSPNELLRFIDDSETVDGPRVRRQIEDLEKKYLELTARARSLRAQGAGLPARQASLADLKRKLEILQQGGHSQAFSDYRRFRERSGAWQALRSTLQSDLAEFEKRANDLAIADLGFLPETAAEIALGAVHREFGVALEELRGKVLQAIETSRTKLRALEAGQVMAIWEAGVAHSEERLAATQDQLSAAGIGGPDEFRGLTERAAELGREIETLSSRQREASGAEAEADSVLVSLRRLRQDLAEKRSAFAQATSGDSIRVEVVPHGSRKNLEDFLRGTFAIERFDDDIRSLCARIDPDPLGDWLFANLDTLVLDLRKMNAGSEATYQTKDPRFAQRLRDLPPERLDRLALFQPDDAVQVSYRGVSKRLNDWIPVAKGSPGQQTAALLSFVLGYGDEPIILDQPEDDLDNTLIYERLVDRLREIKKTRQVIVVTHNPNIVVHGDAELVISLNSDSGETLIASQGGLQEQMVRNEVCRVMEGGREAFRRRYDRIMSTGDRNGG